MACEARAIPQLVPIQSRDVAKWWASVEPLVNRWLQDEETWTAQGVREELEAARAQLWCFYADGVRGIWVTKIVNTDSTKIGIVWGCAGRFKSHRDAALAYFDAIENWLRSQGCKFVDIDGRLGWSKVLSGYAEYSVKLRKRL